MLRLLRRIFKPFPPFIAPPGFRWCLELDGRWSMVVNEPKPQKLTVDIEINSKSALQELEKINRAARQTKMELDQIPRRLRVAAR